MPSVCLYFQVHQPYRLRRYSFFDVGHIHNYEDETENRRILDRVAQKCYLPANMLLLKLIEEQQGKFRIAFSLSGTVLDQIERGRPDVLESFQRLAATGCVEFLNETDSHSLVFLFSPREFKAQVLRHRERVRTLFDQDSRTFRHTELTYSNDLAIAVEKLGYAVILAEGTEKILGRRSPNLLYRPAGCAKLKLLLRNYRLSDDVAFRFSDRNWAEFPLTAAKYAHWLHRIRSEGSIVNLFMDYETFGEHQWEETGIFKFLSALPGEILRHPEFRFQTPAEAADGNRPAGEIDCPEFISWADEERDISAWLGNAMQQDAVHTLYKMESAIRRRKNEGLLKTWRMLQTSDHFYYMCTKWFSDGDVHRYFNPYESPYEAYINYMNILDDLSQSIKNSKGESR
ncbi:MAG: alpha-amylase [Syntrophus sp. RIFOXYC2_FULL_54_9]|nr:MAG: alpha-amylase [Syntrophus sp. GWC2_56_31]OHE27656.1 MAG: alpha-amylase [Syntrophus sp. RIFOXYC2_FULL_54_9]HBB17752.1 alpha-amylase [Syntrophus sp. (in: bacteria)]